MSFLLVLALNFAIPVHNGRKDKEYLYLPNIIPKSIPENGPLHPLGDLHGVSERI